MFVRMMVMLGMITAFIIALVFHHMVAQGEVKLKEGETHKTSRKEIVVVQYHRATAGEKK